MKSLRLQFFVIILLSLLPFLSIFLTSDLPHTSDGEVQIPRMVAFYQAIQDGHIPVRWAGNLNYGYGMPLFNFIYHVPFYISTPLIALGIPLITTFKLVLLISFVLSGITMLLFTREFFKDEEKALLVTILYQFAPYHLIEILVRGSIGGIYAYAFFPLVLYGLTKKNTRITALATACMILSHNSLALVFFGIAVLFVCVFGKNKKEKLSLGMALGLGLGVAAFYWLPALIEHKYTYGDLFMKDLFRVNFPPPQNFFIPNPLDLKTLRVSEIAVHWGIIHSLAAICGIYIAFRQKHLPAFERKIVFFSLALIVGALFFMNPVSTPMWEHISFLRQFQFPWRLLSVILFATSLLGTTFFSFRRFPHSTLYTGVVIIAVISTMFYWRPTQGYDHYDNEQFFWNYPLNTTYFGETDVIWSAGPAKTYPEKRIDSIEGNVTIRDLVKKNHTQTFIVEATTPARLVSHTQYFPGWRVYINGKKTPIEFQDQNWRGLITFLIPEGTHTITLTFEETPIRLVANILSVASIGTILVITLIKKKSYV